jgi:hypothetical protein
LSYTKKVYLAGPMSNLPYFNFPAFFKAEKELLDKGYAVFSPARHDMEIYGLEGFMKCEYGTHEEAKKVFGDNAPTYRECLKVDLNWILDNADAIALLPGWEKSRGVKVEKALAECLDMEVMYL